MYSKLYIDHVPRTLTDEEEALYARRAPSQKASLGAMSYDMHCAVCGSPFRAALGELVPRTINCQCGSTVRWRSVATITSLLLSGRAMPLSSLPRRREIRALGMTCVGPFEVNLSSKVRFENTFFDRNPKLDITEIPETLHSRYDLIISVEVFEHIVPPVSIGLENCFKLLKPGGVLLITVPYGNNGDTVEHFPNLFHYRIEDRNGIPVLINHAKDGQIEEFTNLVFHQGSGATLEMRRFSLVGLRSELESAGFEKIFVFRTPYLPLGVFFWNDWSLPIIASKP